MVLKINKTEGAGSGYLTAIFALLVGETGRAVGVEHIPELTETSIENVKKSKAAHLLASGSLSLHTGGQYSLHVSERSHPISEAPTPIQLNFL